MSTTTTRRRDLAPYLDDPVAFAHQLYRDLAAAGEPRLLEAAPVAYRAFQAAVRAIRATDRAAAADGPGDGLIEDVAMAAHDWAGESHAAGIEFGIAAEALRRALLASAAGPRIPWQPAGS